MLINQNEILEKAKQLLAPDVKSVKICSAYLKEPVLQELVDVLQGKNVEIYVRWHVLDLISGASDLSIFELCENLGWSLFRNPQIHAKFLLNDKLQLLLGSSNYTLSGTGRGMMNIEWNNLIQLTSNEAEQIEDSLMLSQRIGLPEIAILKREIERNEQLSKLLQKSQTLKMNTISSPDTPEFLFSKLPPFRPQLIGFDKHNARHVAFLKNHGVYSLDSINSIRKFILNNPITRIVYNLFEEGETIVRWGAVQRKIEHNPYLFEKAEGKRHILREHLAQDHRLFNLFNWIEHFDNRFEVWNREGYLKDPREGTCSLNVKSI